MTSRHDLANALRQRLLSGEHLGTLHSGERLPTVRQLALEFGVGPRSVLAAYRELEREGLVELRERSGIFFGTRGRSALGGRDAEISLEAAWALDVFHDGYSRGCTVPDVLAILGRYATRAQLRVAGIECNDDQIAGLASALRADFGFEVVGLNVDDLLGASPPPLDEFRLLITTVFHAGEVQELALRANTSWLAISYRSDVFAEIARLLPTTQVQFFVKDPRFEAKLRKIFASQIGAENLHVIRVSDVDATSIPDDSLVYASHTATELLKGHPINERIVPSARLISDDSARTILSFMIQSNSVKLSGLADE